VKVYINKYRDHWLSPYTILEKVFFWKKEIDYDDPFIEKWSNRLEPFSKGLQKFLDFIHPKINYVKIDYWDTWSMDHTLAYMIVPMLKQLQKDKHGAPLVDDEDVPEELRSTSAPPKEKEYDVDGNHFKRWDWVMDEMIWAFEQKLVDDSTDKFYDWTEVDKTVNINDQIKKLKVDHEGLDAHNKRMENGFRLFGKYYQGLWD
jgi:hypothetical protein